MKPYATLVRTKSIIILHTESLENSGGSIVHPYRNRDLDLFLWLHQDVHNVLLQFQDLCTVQ